MTTKLTDEEKQKIEEEEKIRAEARAKYSPQHTETVKVKQKTSCLTLGCVTIFAICIVLPICIGIYESSTKNSSSTSSTIQSVNIGNEGYLYSTNEDVFVPISKEDYEKTVKSSVANDTNALTEMILNEKAFYVPRNTKVLVIDSDTFARQVRILEGEMQDKTGWLPYEFVKPNKQ